MPNKYYLREDRTAVHPEYSSKAEIYPFNDGSDWERHLLSLPALDVDPDYLKRLGTGWFEGEKRYEVYYNYEWQIVGKSTYDITLHNKRLTIVAPQEAEKGPEWEHDPYTKCREVLQELVYLKSIKDIPSFKDEYESRKPKAWADAKIFLGNNPKPATPQPVTGEAGGKSKSKRITLCGSTKFKAEFEAINRQLTLEGNVVYSVCAFGHKDNIKWTDQQKEMLDEVHKRKIDNSDGIFVINVDDYIGESTRSEIEYAEHTGKFVKYLSDFPDLKYISDSAMIAAASRPSDAVEFGDLIEDAVNAYFHQAEKELGRKDLGYIEERNWQKIKNDCQRFFTNSKSPNPKQKT